MQRQSDLTISVNISEPILTQGLLLEIGYDENVFNPISMNFNTSKTFYENCRRGDQTSNGKAS